MADSIEELIVECESYGRWDTDYYERMVHPLPDADVVHRERWIIEQCLDKIVLHFGCTGFLHEGIEEAAKEAWGVDKEKGNASHFLQFDFENDKWDIPDRKWDIIVCGEVLEHLSNPGFFLDKLRSIATCPVIFTVPNAFTFIGLSFMKENPPKENVNKDHVAYYSYHTLKNLLERYKFLVKEFHWCCCWLTETSTKLFSEGLIFVAE